MLLLYKSYNYINKQNLFLKLSRGSRGFSRYPTEAVPRVGNLPLEQELRLQQLIQASTKGEKVTARGTHSTMRY